MTTAPTLDQMHARQTELASQTIHTPTVPVTAARVLKPLNGGELLMKLELLQHTGTFKARGALSVTNTLTDEQKAAGITAVSAGNHAIAAAWAARKAGASAKVVMTQTANALRIAKAEAEGAEVVLKPDIAAAFAEVDRLVADEGRTFVHPFEGPDTTLGTACVGLELMADVANLEAMIVSIGGGGLMSGIATAVKTLNPNCKVYGVEPKGAASMTLSLFKKEPAKMDSVDTIADSLAPPYSLPYSFGLCQKFVDDVVAVSDDQICAAMTLYQEDLKLAVEPAAGATLAAALGPLRHKIAGRKAAMIVCGANIDHTTYQSQLARGADHVAALLGQ